jgi:hypothetical protein
MKTRDYKEIIEDLKALSSENEQLNPETRAQLEGYTAEIERKVKMDTKDNIFIVLFLIILLVGSALMWTMTYLQKKDLEIDNQRKKGVIQQYEKFIRFENDSTHTFEYRTKDGKPITYQELMDENYDLLKENANLKNDLSNKDIDLDVIRKNYGIIVKHKDHHIWAEGAKVDSALILLDVYRDRLKYDPQRKAWVVER